MTLYVLLVILVLFWALLRAVREALDTPGVTCFVCHKTTHHTTECWAVEL